MIEIHSKCKEIACKNCVNAHIKCCVEEGQVLRIKCPFCINLLEDEEIEEILTVKSKGNFII